MDDKHSAVCCGIDWCNYSQTDHSKATFNYMMKQRIPKDIEFAFQGEAIYDFLTAKFSFAFGYYLVINQDFLLKRF